MTHQGAGQRGGCTPCFGRAFGTDVGKAGWSCEEIHAGQALVLLRIPSQLHAAAQQLRSLLPGPLPPAQGDAG